MEKINEFMDKFYKIFPKFKGKIHIEIGDSSIATEDKYHSHVIIIKESDCKYDNALLTVLSHELSHIIFHQNNRKMYDGYKDPKQQEIAADTYAIRLLYLLKYDISILLESMNDLACNEYELYTSKDLRWIYGKNEHPSYIARFRFIKYYYDNQLYKEEKYYKADYINKIYNKFLGKGVDINKLNKIYEWYTSIYEEVLPIVDGALKAR